MKEGWICPRCGKVNAPFVEQCTCKSDSSTTSNFNTDCIHDWVLNGIGSDVSGMVCKYCCAKCGKSISTDIPLGSIKI